MRLEGGYEEDPSFDISHIGSLHSVRVIRSPHTAERSFAASSGVDIARERVVRFFSSFEHLTYMFISWKDIFLLGTYSLERQRNPICVLEVSDDCSA